MKHTITHGWDWWAYQFRVVHRQGFEGIDLWDDRLVGLVIYVLDLRPGERLLDLACGSGVHALRLARRGLEVVGLDIAPRLVRYCREQAAAQGLTHVTFVEGDMRELTFDAEFDACIVLSTSFGFFDDATNQRVLDGIAQALKPGGRLLLDLNDPISLMHDRRRTWQERPEGVYWTESWYDPATGICHGVFRFTDEEGVTHLWDDHERVRVYTLPELRRMLEAAGLAVTAAWGSMDIPPRPYGPECHERMIVVGRLVDR